MGRAEFVDISEAVAKRRTTRRLPVLSLPVTTEDTSSGNTAQISSIPALNLSLRKSPQMLYESFKGLKLTSRPGTQGNKFRPWQEVNVIDTPRGSNNGGVDLRKLHDLATELSDERTADELTNAAEVESVDEQGVTFRFSFKNMDAMSEDNKENISSRSPKHRGSSGSRFTSLETAADRENQKLGLSPVKMTPLRSPRNVKGNPLESLAIGQRPDMDSNGKVGKKRLLRKPLPLNHYKKSQKVRILQNTSETSLKPNVGSDEHIGSAQGENTEQSYAGSENNSGIYSSISEWLDNIKGQDFERVSSNGDPFDVDDLDDNPTRKPVEDEHVDQLAHELKSAQTLRHKSEIKAEHNGKLPNISDKALKPTPTLKMREFHGRFSKMGGEFAPIESDDEEYDVESTPSNDVTHFPRIPAHNRADSSVGSDSSENSGTKRTGYEDPDVKLPRLLMEDSSDENSEKLERQRLRLINIEANAPDTTRSEPPYLPGQYMYVNKGASSHKYSKKQLSLKEMAASFQNRMVHTQSEDYTDGHKVFTEKITKHQSVIDQNTYDYFARKNKPKPAMFSPGVAANTNGSSSKVKPKEICLSLPKQCQHINGNVDPALEINYAKLKHSLRRDNSNVSMKSLSSKRKRSRSREQPGLSRSNSMSSITSTNCSVHYSRRESGKDSASNRRRGGRSVSKNRTRSSRFDRDYD